MQVNLFTRYNELLARLESYALPRLPADVEAAELLQELYKAFPISSAIFAEEEQTSYEMTEEEITVLTQQLDGLEQSINLLCEKERPHLMAFRLLQGKLVDSWEEAIAPPQQEVVAIPKTKANPAKRISEVIAMDRQQAKAVGDENALRGMVDPDAYYYKSPDEVHNILHHLRLLRDDIAMMRRHGKKESDIQAYVETKYTGLLASVDNVLWHKVMVFDGENSSVTTGESRRTVPDWGKVSHLESAGFIFTIDKVKRHLDLHLEGCIVHL